LKFSYFLPTKLTFGFGSVDGIGSEAKGLGASKALVVTDKVMVKTGTVDRVLSKMEGVSTQVYDEVEPEPRIEVAQGVADAVRAGNYDLVVGIGGGSSMDMAKVASGLATNPGEASKYVGNNLFVKKPLPSIMIPTTAGTGAELTVTSMVTVGGHKQWINSPLLLPSAALVDPELTMSMPKSVTAATGMDALCHNAEAYLSSLASPITDGAALEGVRLIASNIIAAYDDGSDRKARELMSLGALMGGIALQAKMVYGHSIGYTLATRYRLPHGVSCGIPLPYILASYAAAAGPRMAKLGEALGVQTDGVDPLAIGKAAGDKVAELGAHLQIPGSLKELGVQEGDLDGLAKECLEVYPRTNSPLVFDQKSMTRLYRNMWSGEIAS